MTDTLTAWLARAKEKAEKATKGPWEYLGPTSGGPCDDSTCTDPHPFVVGPNGENPICYMRGEWQDEQADAAHIAHWSPDVALAVMEVVEAAQELLKYGGGVITDEMWAAGIRTHSWQPSNDLRAALSRLSDVVGG